jgi:hypothetical protein
VRETAGVLYMAYNTEGLNINFCCLKHGNSFKEKESSDRVTYYEETEYLLRAPKHF